MSANRSIEPVALVYLGATVAKETIAIPNPIVVCEVLSPSTAKFDMSEKLAAYFELPSIQHDLIADPDIPQISHHAQREDGTIQTRIHPDASEPLRLDPPGSIVDLSKFLINGA